MRGKLLKSMYGTRDASMNWEKEYVKFMLSAGFIRGQASPCLFYHPGKDIRVMFMAMTSRSLEQNIIWISAMET